MAPNEQVIFEAALRRYERARVLDALVAAALTLWIPAVALVFGDRPALSLPLGVGLALLVALLLWSGGGWAEGVRAGLKAGFIPLGLALVAQRVGHHCSDDACTSWCVPACATGGLLAGVLVAFWARRTALPRRTLAGGLLVSIATGAMGCACVGLSGVVGLVAGALATAPVVAWALGRKG